MKIEGRYPIARFYYRGNHTHPVRRTVVVIESTKKFIRGYELRESNEVRPMKDSPIKTYSRDKIAKFNQIDRKISLRKEADDENKSTLVRKTITDLIINGV